MLTATKDTSFSSYVRTILPAFVLAMPFVALAAPGCGGHATDRATQSDESDAAPPTTTGARPGSTYPSGAIALLTPGYSGTFAGISFYSYSPSSGFDFFGGLQITQFVGVCWQLAFDAQRRLYLTCGSFGTSGGLNVQVLIYPDGAMGDTPPVRVLAGPSLDEEPDAGGPVAVASTAVDAAGNVYVLWYEADAELPKILVFSPDSGSTPVRTIQGPATLLHEPSSIVVDSSGNIYVATSESTPIVEFPAGADGNVAPMATSGAYDGAQSAQSLAFDSSNRLYASVFAGVAPGASGDSVAVFEGGDVQRTIVGPATDIGGGLGPIAVDATGRIFLSETPSWVGGDDAGAWQGTFGLLAFAPGATGNATPESVLSIAPGVAVEAMAVAIVP